MTAPQREPASGHGWSEQFLDAAAAAACSTAESVANWHSVLSVPAFASSSEIETLLVAATATAVDVQAGKVRSETPGALSVGLACRLEQPCAPMLSHGRVRMPIVGLTVAAQAACNELLLRAMELLDAELPALTEDLFDQPVAPELRASGELCASSHSLTFTHNEPAVNVYTHGGDFSPHKDLQALTVLVTLTSPSAFEGGGTAFWSAADNDIPIDVLAPATMADAPPGLRRNVSAPTLVLKPPAGTALLFGGDITHAGQPVTSGQRAVFVASFSRSGATRIIPRHSRVEERTAAMAAGPEESKSPNRTLLEHLYG